MSTKASKLNFEKPLTTVDIVVFSLLENKLNVLLIKRNEDESEPYPNQWALVGGFVDVMKDENLEATARRKLLEKTGVKTAYLEQLASWGNSNRDPRGWSTTHVYFSTLAINDIQTPSSGANASDAQWFDVIDNGVATTLAFDHANILATAIHRLRSKVEYTSLPAFLMPEFFTLKELQNAYEAVLARPLEKSSFRTRMLSTDLLEATPNYKEAANRPAQLYRLKSKIDPVFFQRTFNPIK
ncbi:NUDIX domain-containing protein [Methylotenera sp.]|uniref:NUDIX hydrolase n=1 Tax=Methylotenera sp. TaxID=2051956 RepID=UPI0024889A66|nr:NUDIX domain-containing protein [Methylotenera sp.]MDI1298058.1 NUDIX domain-containing protein [Methylotenera sp.]